MNDKIEAIVQIDEDTFNNILELLKIADKNLETEEINKITFWK